VPFSLSDYLELTDWAGRAIREDKTGAIPAPRLSPILECLNINPEAWLDTLQNYNINFNIIVGTRNAVRAYSASLERQWFSLTGSSLQLYQSAVA
jgi:hypothetical protein